MSAKFARSRTSSANHPVVRIKHGTDPEVQEVDISSRIHENLEITKDETGRQADDFRLLKKINKTKSMTTKSTMTNEDDYTVVHTNTPYTSPTSSVLGENIIDEGNDVIAVEHKIVGWKMTPRVHFPPPNTINASSLQMSGIKRTPLPQTDSRNFHIEIDPPYIHRPDRTLIVHQTKPKPLQPVKAWPGYGGNVYFQPFKINTKPISGRTYSSRTPGSRSNSGMGSRLEKSHTENDAFSAISKYSSFYQSSPSVASRRNASRNNADLSNNADLETSGKVVHRQMARLDKNYIYGLQNNGKLTEDLSWITGMDSLGTLKLGNPHSGVKRQSTNETYTRHTVVEKVPRNFVFHPTQAKNNFKSIQPKMDEKIKSLAVRKYLKHYGIPDWLLKQFVENFYRDERGQLRLPSIPLRVKGSKVPASGKTNEAGFNLPDFYQIRSAIEAAAHSQKFDFSEIELYFDDADHKKGTTNLTHNDSTAFDEPLKFKSSYKQSETEDVTKLANLFDMDLFTESKDKKVTAAAN